jgi:hypothetical protein
MYVHLTASCKQSHLEWKHSHHASNRNDKSNCRTKPSRIHAITHRFSQRFGAVKSYNCCKAFFRSLSSKRFDRIIGTASSNGKSPSKDAIQARRLKRCERLVHKDGTSEYPSASRGDAVGATDDMAIDEFIESVVQYC